MCRLATFLLAFTGLALVMAGTALADIVYLEGGGRVEGVVTDLGSRVKVEGLHGFVLLKKSKIRFQQKTPFITEIYAEKRSRIDDRKADDHYRLAMWCRRNGLGKRATAHLDRSLELDPDHANTRATLGHVKYKDVWLSRGDALNARMAERGFVRYQDRWFTEAGLLAYLDARREELKIEAMAERLRAEREALARKEREDEERLKLLVAERRMVEDALAAAEQTRRERDELLRQNRDLIDLMRERSYSSGWYGGWGIYGSWYGGGYLGRRIWRPMHRATTFSMGGSFRSTFPTGGGLRIRRGNVRLGGAFR